MRKSKQKKRALALRSGSSQSLALRSQGLTLGTVRTAPAAVVTNPPVRLLSYGNLVGAGRESGLLLRGCLPFCTIMADGANGKGLGLTSGAVGMTYISPLMAGTLSPQVARIASCFSRWRFRRLGFIYNAMGSTASGVRMAFAYGTDPLHEILSNVTSYSSYASLLSTPHSTAFSPWASFAMEVPVSSEFSYSYANSGWLTEYAMRRQYQSGVIACVCDSAPGATFSYGILWWAFELELHDPAPVSIPTSSVLGKEDHSVLVTEEKKQAVAPNVVADNPNLGPLLINAPPSVSSPVTTAAPVVEADSAYVRVDAGESGNPPTLVRSYAVSSVRRPPSLAVSSK